MEVSAKEVADILDLINMKWRVGPKGVSDGLGYSRQAIHNWKNSGASEKNYEKLKKFLQEGPDKKETPAQNSECLIHLNLRVDIINPTDESRAKVEKTISILESIRKSWA